MKTIKNKIRYFVFTFIAMLFCSLGGVAYANSNGGFQDTVNFSQLGNFVSVSDYSVGGSTSHGGGGRGINGGGGRTGGGGGGARGGGGFNGGGFRGGGGGFHGGWA